MQLSDYFVGKPGPGSLSEAVHMGLPVITFRSAATMPQERYNTVWVEENKLGKVIPSIRELSHAVEELLKDLPVFQSHVRKINNTAVYEVVEALSSIMHSRSQPKMTALHLRTERLKRSQIDSQNIFHHAVTAVHDILMVTSKGRIHD